MLDAVIKDRFEPNSGIGRVLEKCKDYSYKIAVCYIQTTHACMVHILVLYHFTASIPQNGHEAQSNSE